LLAHAIVIVPLPELRKSGSRILEAYEEIHLSVDLLADALRLLAFVARLRRVVARSSYAAALA
jgi:hypothetical protein